MRISNIYLKVVVSVVIFIIVVPLLGFNISNALSEKVSIISEGVSTIDVVIP